MPRGWLLLACLLGFLLTAPAGGTEDALKEADALTKQLIELNKAGRFQEAVPLAQRTLEIMEKTVGPEHSATVATLKFLARLYEKQGAHGKALPLEQRVLEITAKTVGPEHPDTVTCLNNLALEYYYLGDYDKALPLFQRALKIREKTLGPEHPDTAICINNLAALYKAMAAFEQALPLYQRALKIREKTLGPEHLDTATSLNNLAKLYEAKGAYQEALPLAQRSLRIIEKTRGPEHSYTGQSLYNLASLYQILGLYEKALPLYQRSLKVTEKVHGPEHPVTATSLEVLAGFYMEMGAYEKAMPLYQRALAIREKVQGPEHPDTAICINNLAGLYKAMAAFKQALPLYQRALVIREKVLGPDHPDTASSLASLAGLYFDIAADKQALPLYQRALAIREKVLGPEHPDTAASLASLASMYIDLGTGEQALPLYQRALEIRKKALGPEHPDIARSLDSLAWLYKNMGFYEQALPLLQKALKIREKSLGPEHPDIADSLSSLASMSNNLGAYGEALPLYQRALKIREKALGPEHPVTAQSLFSVASLFTVMGSHDEALPLFQKALEIREKALGPDHPYTRDTLSNLGALYLDRKDYQQAENYLRKAKCKSGLVYLLLARGQAEEALELLSGLAPTWKTYPIDRVQYHTQQGLALLGVGRLGEAALALHHAVQGVEELRRRTPGEKAGFFQGGLYGGFISSYRGLVSVLAEMALKPEALPPALQEYGPGAGAAAFYFAESAKARILLETLAVAARKETQVEIPPEMRTREESLLNRLAALEAQWEKTLQGGEAAVQEMQEEKAQLTSELKAFILELRQKFPLYTALYYPLPIPAAELPLKEDEVLLEFALGEKASYVIMVRRGGVQKVVRIPLGREGIEEQVKVFMNPFLKVAPDGLSLTQAKKLHDLLLAGVLPEVKENERVLVVPDGILGLLPFEALLLQQGTGPQDSVFVGDKYTLTYYQSATVLALKRRLKVERASRPLFALGNPVFDSQDERCQPPGTGDPPANQLGKRQNRGAFLALATSEEWGKTTRGSGKGQELEYPPLKETEDEVRAIAGLMGVAPTPPDVLLNLQANETYLKKSPLSDYRRLHFATHADLPGKVQGIKEPFILLGQVGNQAGDNGFLTLSKVLGLKLRAETVVLSACVTGRGQVMEGEGVANFARAFQHAGAQSVVVSLWEVASKAAVEYMTLFYSYLKEGKPRSEALKLARQAIKAKYPQPFYWAVFILHGEG